MGRLNRIIEIQRRTVVKDSFGAGIESWATLAQVWAEKLATKPSEKFVNESKRLVNNSTAAFRILATIANNPDPVNPFPATSPGQPNELDRVLDDNGILWDIIGIVQSSSDRGHITLEVGHVKS